MKKFFVLAASALIVISLVLAGCGPSTTPTTAPTTVPTTAPTTSSPVPTTSTPATTPVSTSGPGSPTTIKLTFASEKGPNHTDMTQNFPGFFKMVEEATNGKYVFDIEYFPINTLLAPADIYDGIKTGVVDAGQSSTAYTASRFPLLLTYSQPGIAPPKSASAATKAVMDLFAKYNPKEFADTHVLYFYPTGPGWMHANEAITTVDQMKGKKIRVSGVGVEAVKLIGGDPIAMPMGEVYESAQKGLIEVLVSPAETLEGWKHAELFNYSTFVPYIYASDIFFVTMNQNKWNSLPDDLKAAFNSVALKAALRAGSMWDYIHESGKNFAKAQPGGHEFLELSEAEEAKLLELLKPIKDKYTTLLNGQGLPGEQIIADAQQIMDEANKQEYETWKP